MNGKWNVLRSAALVAGLTCVWTGGIVRALVIDFENPRNNDWVAVNQFTVSEGQHSRRPDVVLFVNGLPLAVIELKNPTDENATVWSAWRQLQTYQAQVPALFATNAALVVSDGRPRTGATVYSTSKWLSPCESGVR